MKYNRLKNLYPTLFQVNLTAYTPLAIVNDPPEIVVSPANMPVGTLTLVQAPPFVACVSYVFGALNWKRS